MITRLDNLEKKYSYLENTIEMVDSYAKHFMSESMSMFGIMIAVSTTLIIGSAYFMVKLMINSKIEKEVENKVLKVLSNNNPIFHMKGKSLPNDNKEIILPNTILGIEDLEPSTLMMLETKVDRVTWDQLGKGLGHRVIINENGERVIILDNYTQNGEEVSWALAWVRKRY